MSGRFTSVGLFFSVVAIAMAANRANDGVIAQSRAPASLSKAQILGEFKTAPLLRHTEKLRGPLSVKLEVIQGQSAVVGQPFVMRGIISSRRPLNGTSYTWSIPEGVEVINGQLTGSFAAVNADQPGVVDVTLRKLVSDNVQIHLMASSGQDGQGFGDAAQYNSDVQEMLDAHKTAMAKATTETVQQQKSAQTQDRQAVPARALKIFH